MKLYRSKGSIWTGTQADAKAAQGGKDFEEHDVPTDKPGLLSFLNTFEVRRPETASEPAPAMREEDDETWVAPVAPSGPSTGNPPPTSAADCPACLRSKAVAKMVVNAEVALGIKADLSAVTDARSLRSIIAAAEARIAELA